MSIILTDDAIKAGFEDQRPGSSKPIVPLGHDRFFKLVLDNDERATEIIKHFLPVEIAALMSDEPVKLIAGSFIDPSLGTSQSDRLFEVQLTSGDALLVYTLLEHKSYLDAMTPLQVEEYKFKIWRRYHRQDGSGQVKLPPIVALERKGVTEATPWGSGTECLDLIGPSANRADLSISDFGDLRRARPFIARGHLRSKKCRPSGNRPWIDHFNADIDKVSNVACHHSQAL